MYIPNTWTCNGNSAQSSPTSLFTIIHYSISIQTYLSRKSLNCEKNQFKHNPSNLYHTITTLIILFVICIISYYTYYIHIIILLYNRMILVLIWTV